ncbi:MAG TPA: CDP-alcohol phosphatidyltransferase family protein [Acidimicrobiia bacterium]|nr:CDP-alcohol phosphatidyltransferase family protein [Acidimicrobiia bacterium]
MLTIPNLISFARILLVPLFVWLAVGRDDATSAGLLLGFIGATDWIDGYLARRLGQVSNLGKMLDPLADRFAVAAAVIVGWITGTLPWVVAALLVVRESVVGLGALALAIRFRAQIPVRRMGKIATFGLYFAIPSFYVYEGTGSGFWGAAGWILVVPSLLLYYVVATQYMSDMWRASRAVSSGPEADPGVAR